MEMILGLAILIGVSVGAWLFISMCFRRVAPTNQVHIVQSSKQTTSYGKDTANGNAYYLWPSWVPFIGVSRIILPVTVFDIDLDSYAAYDKDRLPLVVDVKAFFRIVDTNVAAQRVEGFSELQEQLLDIVRGSARAILASSDIESIMQGRGEFGDKFTKEVAEQLKNWGVEAVKNIELMDIRDSKDSQVIHNIMAKKKSHIEMESRQEVAKNNKESELAEIQAKQTVEEQRQASGQVVGLRTVEASKVVELSKQEAQQTVKEQERITKEKEMAVKQVELVRKAEIEKAAQVVFAEQEKDTMILKAEGKLEEDKRQAQAIELKGEADAKVIQRTGEAKASAEKAMQLAPISAQIELAKEIGSNEKYQQYLVTIEQVKAAQEVGKAQASALEKAEVKIFSNSGSPVDGVSNVMDIFSSKGTHQLGGALAAFAQTPQGAKVMEKLGLDDKKDAPEKSQVLQ